ncbi:MAG: DUF523 domain-containing protein [Oscillospiraceae bacterium]|jgi:uncharacterized protein YbbK (DUF523 family)
MNILVSACLLGVPCRYDANSKLHTRTAELLKAHTLVPVCPEVYAGLPTPRPPAEIQNGRVVTADGTDVTDPYERGAREALRLAKLFACTLAILKERSPSCGHGSVHDGSFTGALTPGDGVTAALLRQNGIEVIGESEVEAYFSQNRSGAAL